MGGHGAGKIPVVVGWARGLAGGSLAAMTIKRKTSTTCALAAVACAILLTLSAAAGAATIERGADGTLLYHGGPAGVKMDVQLGYDEASVVFYGSSLDAVTSMPYDCTAQYDNSVITCANPVAVVADLGAGDDHGQVSMDVNFPVTILGGPGRDWLEGNEAANTLDGGAGDDKITGGDGNDVIRGGDGNDDLSGGGGSDALDGGNGDDLLHPDGLEDPSADVVDGGPGTDTLVDDYSSRFTDIHPPVAITLAGGADDGRPGEGDDIHGVEKLSLNIGGKLVGTDGPDDLELHQVGSPSELVGGAGDDVLQGGDGADKLDGGPGADGIDGGYGDDTITGGPGRDKISADMSGGDCGPLWCKFPYGNDTVDVRDGEADQVSCGDGTDTVYADAIDVVDSDCEHVVRSGSAAGGPTGSAGTGGTSAASKPTLAAGARPRLARALAGGLVLRVTGVSGHIATLTAKLHGKVVAKGSARVSAGRATVRLRFTAAARRSLRHHHGAVRLAIAGAGVNATVSLK